MTSTNSVSPLVKDSLFAPLDEDLHLARIAGGNETEVYVTDCLDYVIKVKSNDELGYERTLATALAEAQHLQATAERIGAVIGAEHYIPNYVIVAQNEAHECKPIVIQPFFRQAQPLFDVSYRDLSRTEKQQIRRQLMDIIYRSVSIFFKEGWMPDLYGRTSASKCERVRLQGWHMLPWRLWSFFIQRNLLRSHNLMLTDDFRIVLVDYDPMHHGRLYQWIYYRVRLLLFLRDLVVLWVALSGWRENSSNAKVYG